MNPLDHRPISVTNADNRLVAQALTRSIVATMQDFLEEEQKGFCPGRQGDDHVLDINEFFYSRLAAHERAYLLFLDVRKAFDSLDHNFILGMLEHVGLPPWFRKAIGLLLSQVVVRPVLSSAVDTRIHIRSGVKQGCPLSPLLFVLCYDPLLFALKKKGIRAFGFADDLATASTAIGGVVTALESFKQFSAASGLTVNVSKTKLIRTEEDGLDRTYLDLFNYRGVVLADQATHLGVLIGKEVSTEDVFAKAFTKFERRAARYTPTVKRLPLAKRILVCNCFLTPLFLYLARYYIIPYRIIVEVRNLLRKMVIPFNGGAFAYPHLLKIRKEELAFSTSFRDLWATNYALLASSLDGTPLEGHPYAYYPEMDYVSHEEWGDSPGAMRIREHRYHALFQFLDTYAPREHGLVKTNLNWMDKPKVRRTVYGHLVRQGYAEYYTTESDDSRALHHKLARVGVPDQVTRKAVGMMKQHAARARKVRPAVWDCWLRIAFNCLPFAAKLVSTNIIDNHDPRGPVCSFCTEGVDSTAHVYGQCNVVAEAKAAFFGEHGWLCHTGMEGALLAYPPCGVEHTLGALEFNYAVWRVYQDFLRPNRKAGTAGSRRSLVRRLIDRAKYGLSRALTARHKKKAPPHCPEPGALVFYTDGSADPNPGPTGAGVFSDHQCKASVALGDGTNNVGELFAIGLACELALSQAFDLGSYDKVVIYTDSTYAIGCVQDNWSSEANSALIRAVRAMFRKLSEVIQVELAWVKGHSGVPGNEEADELAGLASKAATLGGSRRLEEAALGLGFGASEWLNTDWSAAKDWLLAI